MFNDDEKRAFWEWYDSVHTKKHYRNEHSILSERQNWIKENPCPLGKKIISLYEEGYGFKTIAKNLDITYTKCRKLLIDYIGVDCRKGTNIVTDLLRKRRSDNVRGEKSPWYDWPRNKPELISNNGKSIQGYYLQKDGNRVWLRSTYEYIIAKWLDKLNLDWKVEVECYELSNGERYRPDFFIYENQTLKTIIEVKSRYFNKGNREYKFHMFKKEHGIDCMIITDIKKFTNNTYQQELKEWKQKRLLVN